MKNFCLILSVFFGYTAFSQDAQDAPMNPEFIEWQHKFEQGYQATGEIPSPILPFFNKQRTLNKDVQFDPVFDMRNYGWLTAPKNQGSCGVCWTFATMGAIESHLLKNGMGTFDFSEQHLRTCHGFTLDENLSCRGGNQKKSAAYLFRGDGPVLDNQSTYTTNPNDTCPGVVTPTYRVRQMQMFPKDNNAVKQALLDHGALYSSMLYDAAYYNSSNYTYFCNTVASTDHAVLMVGWDDNKVTAGGTGAWIIKNSWGTSWGQNGYFYISYNDSVYFQSCSAFTDIVPFDTTIKQLYYDELGWTGGYGYSGPISYALVKFVANGNIALKSVSTYAIGENATLDISIYGTKSGNTLTELLAQLPTQNFTYPGYYTLDLPSTVNINDGDDFYVKIKYNVPNYQYTIPVEKYIANYSDPFIEDGVFWVSSSGTSWTAMGSSVSGKERDACVHVSYTHQTPVEVSEKTTKNEIRMYPQPAENILNIEFPSAEERRILISDFSGRDCLEINGKNDAKISIDISGLKNGIYFITVECKNEIFRYKFIR